MTIRKRGPAKFQLVSRSGKVLGTHRSRAGAQRQERAIQASKRRRK